MTPLELVCMGVKLDDGTIVHDAQCKYKRAEDHPKKKEFYQDLTHGLSPACADYTLKYNGIERKVKK